MASYHIPPKNINQLTTVNCPKEFGNRSLQYALATEFCDNITKTPTKNLKNIRKTVEKIEKATHAKRGVQDKANLTVSTF